MGEGVQRLQVVVAEGAAHVAATAHAGHLLRVDPAVHRGRRTQAHRLEARRLLAEAGVDAGAIVEFHQQAFLPVSHTVLQA
ncbi:Uncharacterised protein [Acinetobacter baumannii]|nr:Uncharacterised protein [Acinetobacter baumannii]